MASPPVEEHSVDIITGGYALRNAPDLDKLLTSVWHKLKPGGTASFLDFSKSDNPFIQVCQLWILKIWTGLFGLILHGNPVIYSYIASSLSAFPTQKQLQAKLEHMGFKNYTCIYHHKGFISTISFVKPLDAI
jgi:demethylmenaquinone methyltransferase/2-methoxy-6-polyprenyl-1,4-benzoquinol methylase